MIYQIKDGYKQYQNTHVFRGIDFNIKRGEKVALVGRNGAGKTTLMRIIAEDERLDSGDVYHRGDFEVAYLSQASVVDENHTILEEVRLVFTKVKAVLLEVEKLAKELETNPEDQTLLNKYQRVFEHFESLGGYHYEYEMTQVLSNFGFSEDDLEQTVGSLSGGERTKVAFAKLLLQKPDLLLLDEPTNHLDLSTIEWLEGYLRSYPQALIIVSHDQMFIDNIVSKIWEIEYGRMTSYTGNYSSYETQKETHLLSQKKHYDEQQKEIKRLEALIDKYRESATKAAFAQSKIKYLDRMEKIELDSVDSQVFKASFKSGIRGSNKVLEVNDLEVGYDEVLAKISLTVMRGDKIAIIGDNGTGKSTFVKTIMDKEKPLSGEFLWGHSITKSYFDQDLAQVDSNKTVIEDIWDTYPSLTQREVRSLLGSFLFKADDVFKVISVLSGGEKVRLSLLKVMYSKANTLVLDEPTNHLDILSKRALADAMNDYDGSIIFVSHDRHFINSVANKIVLLKDKEIIIFSGTYQEYQDKINGLEKEVVEVKEVKTHKKEVKTYSNNWIKDIEKKMKNLEEEIEDMIEMTYDPEIYEDHLKYQEINDQIEASKESYALLSMEYLEYLESLD